MRILCIVNVNAGLASLDARWLLDLSEASNGFGDSVTFGVTDRCDTTAVS